MISQELMLAGTTKVWTPPRLTTETRPDSHIGQFFFFGRITKVSFKSCVFFNLMEAYFHTACHIWGRILDKRNKVFFCLGWGLISSTGAWGLISCRPHPPAYRAVTLQLSSIMINMMMISIIMNYMMINMMITMMIIIFMITMMIIINRFLNTQVSLAPTHVRSRLVGWFVRPSHFRISILSQSENGNQRNQSDLWPMRHLIRVMRRNEPGVYGGLNASQVGLYVGSDAQKCMMAAMLFKNIYTDGV